MYFGTDPEYLVVNRLGRPVPAHKVGFDDKDNKLVLRKASCSDEWESRAFRDGYMVEVNITPDTCRQTATYRMQRALQALRKKLAPRYTIVATPAVKINLKKDMAEAPPDVLQFGCEPSYCAYELEAKIPLIDAITHPFRYAGGHLHFGYNNWSGHSWMLARCNHPMFIKLMDLYVGLPLTYLFDSTQTFQRRRFYGQAGEFRSQKYGKEKHDVGVEYRTPGPEVWNAAWIASFAMGVGRHLGLNFKNYAKKWDKKIESDLRLAINTGDGIEKLLKLAVLPGYYEYPLSFRPLKKYAPKQILLWRERENQVGAGWRGWAHRANIDLIEGNDYEGDGF